MHKERSITYMLSQQLLAMGSQCVEVVTSPFPHRKGFKGGLEVMCPLEA